MAAFGLGTVRQHSARVGPTARDTAEFCAPGCSEQGPVDLNRPGSACGRTTTSQPTGRQPIGRAAVSCSGERVTAAAEQEPPSQHGTGAHDSQLFDVSTGEGQTRRSRRNRRHLGRRRIAGDAGGCDSLGTPTGGRRDHTARLGHRPSRCTARGSGRARQHRQRCNCQARTYDQSSCPHDGLPLLPAGAAPRRFPVFSASHDCDLRPRPDHLDGSKRACAITKHSKRFDCHDQCLSPRGG